MNKEEFIGKLQLVYVGDKRASEEIISEYDRLNNIVRNQDRKIKFAIKIFENIKKVHGEIACVSDVIDVLKENNK